MMRHRRRSRRGRVAAELRAGTSPQTLNPQISQSDMQNRSNHESRKDGERMQLRSESRTRRQRLRNRRHSEQMGHSAYSQVGHQRIGRQLQLLDKTFLPNTSALAHLLSMFWAGRSRCPLPSALTCPYLQCASRCSCPGLGGVKVLGPKATCESAKPPVGRETRSDGIIRCPH